MNFSGHQLKKALHDAMDFFGIELLAERGVVREISEQDGQLSPLAFQRGAPAQDLLGKMARYVRNERGRGAAGLARF